MDKKEKYVAGIMDAFKNGERKTFWLFQDIPSYPYPEELQRLFEIVPLPPKKAIIWPRYTLPSKEQEEILVMLGVGVCKKNIKVSCGFDCRLAHDYCLTKYKDIFIHYIELEENGGGTSNIIVSVGIPEEEFTQFNNMSETYRNKMKEIDDALANPSPRTIMLSWNFHSKRGSLILEQFVKSQFEINLNFEELYGGLKKSLGDSDDLWQIKSKLHKHGEEKEKQDSEFFETTWAIYETIYPGVYYYYIYKGQTGFELFGKIIKNDESIGEISFLTFNISLKK